MKDTTKHTKRLSAEPSNTPSTSTLVIQVIVVCVALALVVVASAVGLTSMATHYISYLH